MLLMVDCDPAMMRTAGLPPVPSDTHFPRFGVNTLGRDFAVGDIHGCFEHLSRSLAEIGFDASADRLFSVGDLVDRGPESDKVLEWLARPWFTAICGNHDFLTWRTAFSDPFPAVDHLRHGGTWLGQLTADDQMKIGRRLSALPLAMEIETASGVVGLVHADCPFDDWADMQSVPWRSVDPTSTLGHCCLWSIDRYSQAYTGHVRNVRAVVHGHMLVAKPEVLGNVHFIDTGGWKPGGFFTFLELGTLKPVMGPRLPGSYPAPRRNR